MKPIETLQSMRFLFVVLIFFSHFAYGNIAAFDAGGDCGVAFFFVLSGFVCSLGYGDRLRNGAFCHRSFLFRRLRKIYPLHLLCLVAIFVAGSHSIDTKVVLNALLLQSWVPNAEYYFSFNGVSWFLSSLLFCYAVFPFACRNLSRTFVIAVLVAYAVFFVAIPYDKVNALLYVFPLTRFVDFMLGMALCRLFERNINAIVPRWAEVGITLLLVVSLFAYPIIDEKVRTAPLYWFILLPMIYVFALQNGPLSRITRKKALLRLGGLAMPFYMVHQMVINAMLRFLPDMAPVLMLALCFAASLCVAFCISWLMKRMTKAAR